MISKVQNMKVLTSDIQQTEKNKNMLVVFTSAFCRDYCTAKCCYTVISLILNHAFKI